MTEFTLRPLDRPASWTRLGASHLGRLATSLGALPIVVPVNYVVGDDVLLFAVEKDSPLTKAIDRGVFALEASGHDEQCEHWWSVLVRGTAEVLDAGDPRARQLDRLELPMPIVAALGTVNLLSGAEVPSLTMVPSVAAYLATGRSST